MKIPCNTYTIESFLDYIIDNSEKVFDQKEERKWLKVYLLYTAKEWKNLFEGLKMEDYGEITHIVFEASIFTNEVQSLEDLADYYVYQWVPGLILIFTSSTKESYEKTIKQFIHLKKGITETWIRPMLLEQIKNYLVDRYDGKVYHFIGRRFRYWKYPSKIRSEYDRRINYSGEDANQTLKEIGDLYGIIPSSIDIRIIDSKLQINRNGLFIIRHINRKTISILQEMIDKIVAEQIRIRDTSEKFNVQTKTIPIGIEKIIIPRIVAGKITLPNTILSRFMIDRMFHQKEHDMYYAGHTNIDDEETEIDFSFIDTYIKENPLVFTAIVVDEVKGTVFGISGEENEIALIPKHRITFESFINFYDYITENFDIDAKLNTFSEEILA